MIGLIFGETNFPKYILKRIKKKEKYTIIDLTKKKKFTPELSLPRGNYSIIKPNLSDKKDISVGEKALNKSGKFSYVQGVICRNKSVLALEGSTGTHKMINKVKKNKSVTNGVLIKFPKKRQDIRIDLPTIGLETFKQCKKAGLKGIVLKHKLNIFLDRKESIKFANKNKMFILVK